jgi:hypothetical protein
MNSLEARLPAKYSGPGGAEPAGVCEPVLALALWGRELAIAHKYKTTPPASDLQARRIAANIAKQQGGSRGCSFQDHNARNSSLMRKL